MDVAEIEAWRKRAGLSQAELAERIGLSHRAYSGVATGTNPLRPMHILAVERVSLDIAVDAADPMLALPAVRKAALTLNHILMGD